MLIHWTWDTSFQTLLTNDAFFKAEVNLWWTLPLAAAKPSHNRGAPAPPPCACCSPKGLALPSGNSFFPFRFRCFSHASSHLLNRKTMQTKTVSHTLGCRLAGKSNPSLLQAIASEEPRGGYWTWDLSETPPLPPSTSRSSRLELKQTTKSLIPMNSSDNPSQP